MWQLFVFTGFCLFAGFCLRMNAMGRCPQAQGSGLQRVDQGAGLQRTNAGFELAAHGCNPRSQTVAYSVENLIRVPFEVPSSFFLYALNFALLTFFPLTVCRATAPFLLASEVGEYVEALRTNFFLALLHL